MKDISGASRNNSDVVIMKISQGQTAVIRLSIKDISTL
jgi:hypothetical protein